MKKAEVNKSPEEGLQEEKLNDRQLRIKGCADCNGSPETEPLELSDYNGTKCTKCGEVVTYKKK